MRRLRGYEGHHLHQMQWLHIFVLAAAYEMSAMSSQGIPSVYELHAVPATVKVLVLLIVHSLQFNTLMYIASSDLGAPLIPL